MCEAISFSNNSKQVITGNNTAGPRLPTNAVSIMQCTFGFDCLFTMQLVLIPVLRHQSGIHICMNLEVRVPLLADGLHLVCKSSSLRL